VTGDGDLAGGSGIPYFCQWESPELVPAFIDGSLTAAGDPRWAESGARTREDYAFWSRRSCGLACLKMLLAVRGLAVPPMMRLVDSALECKAFIRDGERVAGLIYRPFADWIASGYGIKAEVMPDLPLEIVAGSASPETPVIASVHPSIRWPERTPPERGGHLILVTGAAAGVIRLHNPSGLPGVSQRDALVARTDFSRFFAGRGLIIRS
jgi:hypothetical protein